MVCQMLAWPQQWRLLYKSAGEGWLVLKPWLSFTSLYQLLRFAKIAGQGAMLVVSAHWSLWLIDHCILYKSKGVNVCSVVYSQGVECFSTEKRVFPREQNKPGVSAIILIWTWRIIVGSYLTWNLSMNTLHSGCCNLRSDIHIFETVH